MKFAAYIFFIITSFMVFNGCSNTPGNNRKEYLKTEQVAYTCPMHPEIVSDEPGKCPICGMDLVVKKDFVIDSTQVEMPSDTMDPLNM